MKVNITAVKATVEKITGEINAKITAEAALIHTDTDRY
jgi:hypothetical protein